MKSIKLTLFDTDEPFWVDIEHIGRMTEWWKSVYPDKEILCTTVELRSLKMKISVRESVGEINVLIEKAKEEK